MSIISYFTIQLDLYLDTVYIINKLKQKKEKEKKFRISDNLCHKNKYMHFLSVSIFFLIILYYFNLSLFIFIVLIYKKKDYIYSSEIMDLFCSSIHIIIYLQNVLFEML